MWGEIQTDSAANNALKEGDDAFNNYRKLQGQDAIDAEQSAKEHINQLVEQRRAQLTSPWQKDLFDKQVRQYQYRYWNGGIANHANEQRNVFTSKTNSDTEEQGYNHIAQNFNNDAEFQVGLQQALAAAAKQVQFNGQFANADARNQAVQIVTARAYTARAEAMYAHNAPGGYAFAKAHEKEMGLYAAPLLDKFKARADSENAALKSDVMRRITDAPNDTVRLGIVHANQGVLGNDYTGLVTQFGGAAPGQAPAAPGTAPPSNVVPMPQVRPAVDPNAIRPGENPPDYAKRLLLQNEQKPVPTKPAGPDELGRVGGPNARIDIPPNPSMLTAGGRAEFIRNALKQYQPLTRLSIAGHEFVVPPDGTTFSYEGNSYTVPGGKPQQQPAAAEPTPLPQPRPAVAAPQPAPQQQGQNFTPIPAGGQAAINAAAHTENATPVPQHAAMQFGAEPNEPHDHDIAAYRQQLFNPNRTPAQEQAQRETAVNSTNRVIESQLNGGHVRDLPIKQTLRAQLDTAANATDTKVIVRSGGQPSSGRHRTGSHRHDNGGAADIELRDAKTGRLLDMGNAEDQARMAQFVTAAVRAGATGVGAGQGYMGPHMMHIGGGSPMVWGQKGEGRTAPAWLEHAWLAGRGQEQQAAQ